MEFMMQAGDEIRVRIIEHISDKKARVVDVNNDNPGIIQIKGNLKILKDGTVNAWVLQDDKKAGMYQYGNAYFGKFSISRKIADRYVSILNKLYDNPETIVADDISSLKGMCNRCLKKDQWDWFTTYKYLGYPVQHTLREFVADAVVQRDQLREGIYDNLPTFRMKYHGLLSSIMFHLSQDVEVDDQDIDVPIPAFDKILWERMSFESRKNIKMAVKIHNKSSRYTLMHYFVTLEQEFQNHFIQPYIASYKNKSSEMRCLQNRYQRTHDTLTGKSHFTLGTVYFLGEFVNSVEARASSDAIQMYFEFLGEKMSEFITICSIIGTERINGVSLSKLRNGLAHGDTDVISTINVSTFSNLHSYLFDPPQQVLKRILLNSMKYA